MSLPIPGKHHCPKCLRFDQMEDDGPGLPVGSIIMRCHRCLIEWIWDGDKILKYIDYRSFIYKGGHSIQEIIKREMWKPFKVKKSLTGKLAHNMGFMDICHVLLYKLLHGDDGTKYIEVPGLEFKHGVVTRKIKDADRGLYYKEVRYAE